MIFAEIAIMLFIFMPIKWSWIIALSMHVLISLVATIWLSKRIFHHKLMSFKIQIALFLFIVFFPVISLVVIWLLSIRDTLRKDYKLNELKEMENNKNQESYEFLEKTKLLDGSNKIKNTRNLLSTLNDENYLKLLIASRHLPDKEAYALLKEALGSPFESARLMAFSLKEKLEQRLQDSLQKDLDLLENLSNSERAEQHLLVARDYIHLLDIGMYSGREDKLLKQAEYHCLQSIKFNKKSAYSYQTLSKIFSYQGKIKKSQLALKAAAALQ